jgi:hypothetical protein
MHPAPQPVNPTSEELSDGARLLLAEADAALNSSAFAVLNKQTRSTLHRYYDAAAVRHCCQLLKDIELSSDAGQEMTVRILTRAFIEAWLTALYIHFGGYEAFERVVQGTAHQVKLTEQDLKEFDERLLQAKKTAKKRLKAVAKANVGITQWNAGNPSRPPKQVHDEPYIPQLTPTGIDISRRLAKDLKGVKPRPLPLTEITDCLTELGPEKGFAQETFRPLYIYYRMLSAGSAHANINTYDAYYQSGPGFNRAAAQPTDDSLTMPLRITALYCTAFLIGWILLDAGIPAPVATELRHRYEPDPTGQASWAPGAPAAP